MPSLDGLLLRAYRDGVECTLVELRAFPEFDGLGLMASVAAIAEKLSLEGLSLQPPIDEGEIDQVRVMARTETVESFRSAAKAALVEGESAQVEFKESLYLKKKLFGDTKVEEKYWVGEEIIYEVVSSICSFLNGDGGTLLIGVSNDNEIVGIECECNFIPGDGNNLDSWELFLSNCLEKFIYDFKGCIGYVKRKIIEIDEKKVCVVIVKRRSSSLTVCQAPGERNSEKVFVRNGNGKAEIKARAIEHLVLSRIER